MNKDILLSYIDEVDSSVVESELNVCSAILEFYDKTQTLTEFDDNGVFMEAAAAKESVGGKIKNVIKTIVASINKLFNKIVNKMFGVSSNSEKDFGKSIESPKEVKAVALELTKGKPTGKKRKKAENKIATFRKNHPIIAGFTGFAALVGGAFGASKAIDAVGKATATKSLDETDRAFIKKNFDPSTKSITLPFNTTNIGKSVEACEKIYSACVNSLESRLGITDDTPMTAVAATKFIKDGGMEAVKSQISKVEELTNLHAAIEGGAEKTVVSGGAEGWDSFSKKMNTIFEAAEINTLRCVQISNIVWDIACTADDSVKDEKFDNEQIKIADYLKRHTDAMNRITEIRDKLVGIDATVSKFYHNYTAVEKKLTALKKEIAEAIVYAVKLVSASTKKLTDLEEEKLDRLIDDYNALVVKYNSLETECDSLGVMTNAMKETLDELEKKKKQLSDEIKKLESIKSGKKSED